MDGFAKIEPMSMLISPFVNALFGLYYWFGNLGLAVVVVTVVIRVALLPLVLPSLKSATRMRELQPKLDKLKKKYGSNKEKLAKAQMDFYKSEGINPLSGCLPQILQIAVLLMFFSAFRMVTDYVSGNGNLEKINSHLVASFRIEEGFEFNSMFLGSDLIKTPANVFSEGVGVGLILPLVLLVGSGLMQFLSAKKMMPAAKVDKSVAKKTKDKEDDMAVAMQKQMTYIFPVMTIFIGLTFPSGLVLYWLIFSLTTVVQQLVINRSPAKAK